METEVARVEAAAVAIRERSEIRPVVGIISGTGLGESTGRLQIDLEIPYSEIPGFPVSTVESHAGTLVLGTLSGVQVVAMRGRNHLYEGYSAMEVAFPVRVMKALGVDTLLVTNAAGGIGPKFAIGDLMVITDHINMTGRNPLVGPNLGAFGIRFPDMSAVYDRDLRALAHEVGTSLSLPLEEGVYVGLLGPSLETPAEIRMFGIGGADAVGMSTVTEVIAARHCGIRVLGISTITNINDPENPVVATIEEIVAEGKKASAKLEKVLVGIIERMGS